MVKIVWTRKAVNDLKHIFNFISIDSKIYAKQWVDKLVSRVDQLSDFPESGRIIPEKNDPLFREIVEGNYRIFYKLQKGNVVILRVHSSYRQIVF
jgi:addiction module RelE/StbE family toxin